MDPNEMKTFSAENKKKKNRLCETEWFSMAILILFILVCVILKASTNVSANFGLKFTGIYFFSSQ